MHVTVKLLAQILGQPFNERPAAEVKKGEAHLRALSLLSDFGTLWKTLHHSYHAILPSVAAVTEVLTVNNHGQRVPARPADIAPGELRRLVFTENLNFATVTFQQQTRKAIAGIEEMLTPTSPPWDDLLAALKRSTVKRLGSNIESIAEDRTTAVRNHGEFLTFLAQLSRFSAEPDWNMDHVRFFLDSRPVLDEKFHEVIRRADSVLFQMLECFTEITNHYYREA